MIPDGSPPPNHFNLPRRIRRLADLAYNLWWTWNHDAERSFRFIDFVGWEAARHNPVSFLRQVPAARLKAVIQDRLYLALYDQVIREFDAYMAGASEAWYARSHADRLQEPIAYFSTEFGLHESLPFYAGGLGVLSGDHLKEASDLGMPLVALGFLYTQGYFSQHITEDGWQEAHYASLIVPDLRVHAGLDTKGEPLTVQVDLPGRAVHLRLWRVQVGRVPLYLMDSNVPQNQPVDRELSARLYTSELELRISQEIILGIGGVRALRELGYNPQVWHMNEGHSAFLALERVRELVAAGRDFEAALARHQEPWGETFSMAVLAMRVAGRRNGVSELHGKIARKMWAYLWPGRSGKRVPIGYITNGVHTSTWIARRMGELFNHYLPEGWLEHLEEDQVWQAVDRIPDDELWEVRRHLKRKLIAVMRERSRGLWEPGNHHPVQVVASGVLLDPYVLTIGFARRFATYKRANLLLHDPRRLLEIVNRPGAPVQFILAGKAHPADDPGKQLIQEVYRQVKRAEFAGRLVFLEDYDMTVARNLIQGVDVWLNTPQRLHEASGTSGQKAAVNGVLNCSVLDGWWAEGFNGQNGWGIAAEQSRLSEEAQAAADAESLYRLLEEEIVPLYYSERSADDLPGEWLGMAKESMRSLIPRFSMRRMVKQYVEEMYLPSMPELEPD